MKIDDIKTAAASGQAVHWKNTGYSVICDKLGQWLIVHHRGSCIGLCGSGGQLNGQESDFFIGLGD